VIAGAEPDDQTGVRENRNRRRWLAYVSAFGGEHVGRHGRATSSPSAITCATAISTSPTNTCRRHRRPSVSLRQTGRRDPSERIIVCKQIPPDSVNSPGQIRRAGRQRSANESCLGVGALIGPKWTQIFEWGFGQLIERNGRHEETRTPDLYRVKGAVIFLTTTYMVAGDCLAPATPSKTA
jgi:hypothetical protein